MLLGTPVYMSPEQARGEEVGPASDLYSFGLLLQWLLTEEPNYPPTLRSLEVLELASRGESRVAAGLDPELATLVSRLRALDPEARPTASEVVQAIATVRARPERQRQRRRLLAGAAAVLLAVAGSFAAALSLAKPRPLLGPGEEGRVALLPFENATGEARYAWVEEGLAPMVAQTLDQTPRLDVVRQDDVRKALAALHVESGGGDPPPATLARLARALGTRWLVHNRVEGGAGELRFRYTIYDATGSLGSRVLSGSEPTALAGALAAQLSRRFDPQALRADLEDQFSADPLSNQLYAMGLDRAAKGAPKPALDYFAVCLDRDPDFARARLQRAGTRYKLGEWDQAAAELEAVAALARGSGDQKLLAEALAVLGGLFATRGDYQRAEEILAQVLPLQERLGDFAGQGVSWNALGFIARQRSDLPAAERAFSKSLEIFRRLGHGQHEVGRLINLAFVSAARGELEAAAKSFAEAVGTARELGIREEEAAALHGLGNVAQRSGKPEEAEEWLRQALTVFTEIGSKRGQVVSLVGLGGLARDAGRDAEADDLTQRGLALARELGDRPSEAHALADLALAAARRGDQEAAQRQLAAAAAIVDAAGDRNTGWVVILRRAEVLLLSGAADAAATELGKALVVRREGEGLRLLARVEKARGRTEAALAALLEAKALGGWSAADENLLASYRSPKR